MMRDPDFMQTKIGEDIGSCQPHSKRGSCVRFTPRTVVEVKEEGAWGSSLGNKNFIFVLSSPSVEQILQMYRDGHTQENYIKLFLAGHFTKF